MALPLGQLGAYGGAALGSVFPGLGTALGGALGGALGSLGEWYLQPGATPQQQQQEQLAQQQFQASQQLLQQMQNRDYGPEEEEERLAFERDILPQIKSQFSSPGGLRSSSFQNALVRGREDLGVRIAALRQRGELARQGQLGNYLYGQQNLGLNLLGLGQGQQGNGIQGLNNIANYANNLGQLGLNQNNARINAGLQTANIGRGQQAQAFYHPATSGLAGPAINSATRIGLAAAGI